MVSLDSYFFPIMFYTYEANFISDTNVKLIPDAVNTFVISKKAARINK